MHDRLLRIGIFYDGTYFQHVSNFYAYGHPIGRRISIEGLHRFVQRKAAELEGVEERYCRVVDAHYFRGRLPAAEAQDREILYGERVFEDVLMRAGVTTHYLPLASSSPGIPAGHPGEGPQAGFREKGIDVWFALEAYELAREKGFGVSVLLTGDADHVPLIRKLNALGTRVMLLGWDLERAGVAEAGRGGTPKVARALMEEATYPVEMGALIERELEAAGGESEDAAEAEPLDCGYAGMASPGGPIADLFVPAAARRPAKLPEPGEAPSGAVEEGVVVSKNEKGFGFISPRRSDKNGSEDLFFFQSELQNTGFRELPMYAAVEFRRGRNERGPCAVEVRVL